MPNNLVSKVIIALLLFPASFALARSTASVQTRQSESKESRIIRIQDSMQQGNLVEARKLLSQAMKRFPADPGLDNLLGIIEAQEKNYRAAEAAFQRAVARAPKFTGAYLNLGRLYQEHFESDTEAVAKALRAYGKVLQYEPENAEANYQSAVLLQLRGNYRASLDHMLRLPADYRRTAQSLSILCANYAGLGDRARADETADLLLKHPELSEADVNPILSVLARAQAYDLSIKLLEGLTSRGSPQAMHRLGLLYEQQGKLDRARAALERSATKEGPLAGLLMDLARVAYKQRDYRGALGYLAHARDLDSQNAMIHYLFGMVCIDLNLGAEAHAAIGKAVSLEPDNPQYNFAMGYVSSHRHNPEEAVPYLQKYLQLRPGDPRGRLMIGMAYFRSKNYDAARKELLEAARHSETAAPAHYYLGSIARQNNSVDEAMRELEQALRLKPNYVDALAEMGQCRLQQRDYEMAEKFLRRALEIDPDHYTANFNLLTLYSRTKNPRVDEQTKKFDEIRRRREERAQDFLRTIEVRPYDN